MAIVKNLIPTNRKQGEKSVLIDDFFDPLFNRRAKEQIRNTYGVDGLFTPVYGYAEFLDNTFFPNESKGWGPLGPAMGVLGGFGRTLDKAEDFILGGVTEGVNAINQINPLSSTPNVQVHNPLSQVFIEDDDYTGEKLLAAMANNMGRLAGNTAVSEQDFDGTWKPTALGIELATDPGIFGGFLAKSATNSSAKSIGQLLSDYDDILARGAWDVTIPGARPFIKNHLGNIRQLLAANTATPYQNVNLKNLSSAGKSRDEFVNDVLEEQIYNANTRWQNTMQSVQELSKTFDNIPEVTKQLRSQLDEIEKNVKLYGKPDDDFVNTVNDIRLRLDDIDKYIADPKQFNTELFDTKVMTDTVNRSLKIKDFTDFAQNTYKNYKDYEYVTDALKSDDVAILTKEGFLNPKYALNSEYYLDTDALLEDVEDILKDRYSNLPWTTLDEYNDLGEFDSDEIIEAIENKSYFKDSYLSDKAYDLVKELKDNYYNGGHLARFTTSVFNNSKSDLGDYAVKLLQNELNEDAISEVLTNTLDNPFDFKKYASIPLDYKEKAFKALDDPNASQELLNEIKSKYVRDRNAIYSLPEFISHQDIDYINNNLQKLHGLTKKSTSNLDKLKAAEAISDKLENIARHSYGYNQYNSSKLRGAIDTYRSIVNTAKYGYDFGIRNNVKSLNMLMANFKDPWTVDTYRLVKQHLRDTGSNIDLMLDKSFKMPYSEIIKHNPKLEGQSIHDLDQLLDVVRRRVDFGLNPTTVTGESIRKHRTWMGSLKAGKTNEKLMDNYYARLGFDELNPLEQSYVKYLDKEFKINNLYGKDKKDKIFDAIRKQGLDFDVNFKNADAFLISPPAKKAEDVVLPDLDEQMKIGKERAVDASLQKLSEIPDDAFAKYVFKVKDLNTDIQLATFAKRLQESGIPEEEQRTLFKMISEQMQVPNKISRGEFPTLQTERVQSALKKTLDIESRYGIDPNKYDAKKYAKFAHDTSQYFQYLDSLNGDITKADSFLDELFESGGIFIRNLDKTANKAEFDALRKDLMHNVITINKLSKGKDPILKLVEQPIEGNKYALGVMLNLDNKKAVVDYAKLNIPDGALKDIIWEAPNEDKAKLIKEAFDKSGAKFTFNEMDDIFNDTRKASEDFSRMIGYEKFSPNYFMHTMSYSDHAERYLGSKVYHKIDTEKLADMANEFQNYRKVGYQHAFNIKPISRKLRGSIESWNTLAKDVNIFSVNPHEITKRTFTDGLFKDANFQNHVGMFFNPNFRISSYAENIDDLKDILFARNGKGELTGNLDNLVLASPKYNEAGRLIGYQQYNKFDDKSLQRALKNPETVLLPTHALAPLDKILRKDLKMSNKVYAFINKYFTIPVKFGTLTNLGFLTGNIGDAYLKQAITMSDKYGTSVAYELARNAESVKNVVVLNNRFDSVFTKYVADMEKAMGKDKFIDYYRLTDSLISTPKAKLNFEEWLDKSVASGKITTGDRNVSRLWLYLNNYEQVMTGDFQNLGDLLEMQSKSEYAKPLNPAEKVVNKAVNIKPTKKIMWASGKVEEYARAAEILNDLTRHYSSKEIYQILGDPEKFAKEFEMMNVRMSEALNTMNTSNFNYEYLNDVLDSFGSLVPFPTFVTKNFAYWLDIMVNKPEVMDTIINMQNVAWRGKDTKSDQFQAEAKGRGAIPLKASKNSQFLKGIFKPTPYQSMFGAFDLMQNPVENLAFRVNPIATPITHHLQKAENDKYRPYSFDPYEKNIKRGDPNYSALKATFHRLNPYDRTLQNWLRLPANMGQKTAQISNVLPSVFQPDFSKTSSSKNKKR